jgi:hypothetical protein
VSPMLLSKIATTISATAVFIGAGAGPRPTAQETEYAPCDAYGERYCCICSWPPGNPDSPCRKTINGGAGLMGCTTSLCDGESCGRVIIIT